MKIKTEAYGCQPGKLCLHKTDFLQRLELNEGVKLDPDKISYNEGLRFISKILFNSFWMRENLSKTRYINNYTDVIEYFIRTPLEC